MRVPIRVACELFGFPSLIRLLEIPSPLQKSFASAIDAGVTPQPPQAPQPPCVLDSPIALRAADTVSGEEVIELASALGAGQYYCDDRAE